MRSFHIFSYQWWIHDFLKGVHQPYGVFSSANLLFGKTFAENCMKLKKSLIERRMGCIPSAPPFGSTNAYDSSLRVDLQFITSHTIFIISYFDKTYPKIGKTDLKRTLLTSKQQLALKIRVRCRISIVLL